MWLNKSMKYVVAVSGGVDSAVLLHMLVASHSGEIVVAHFDHGIRSGSADDAEFVRGLAKKYGVPFELGLGNLGPAASEEAARTARYAFLHKVAERYDGRIVTAHHQNDIIETIAINLIRGTGWRGLAVLRNPAIFRPLLTQTKQAIYDYALKRGLEWVEDETNQTDAYMRNRLRRILTQLDPKTHQLLIDLWKAQAELALQIDDESRLLLSTARYFMTMIDEKSALELLRCRLAEHSRSLTRPQRSRLLLAVKTARPGSIYQAGPGVEVQFTKREYIVKYP